MTDQLPEAPASVTLSVVTPKGYPALYTLRETSGMTLITKIATLEGKLEEAGYKPQEQRGYGGKTSAPVKYVEGKTCPKDGGRLIEKTKKNGEPFWKCENQKYNPTTRQSFGCDYIDWDAGKAPQGAPTAPRTEEPPVPEEDLF